jgi:crotonobetainyl-CoA:carnitine CoA-transferase CaiB-like acyl-CoA transferase
MAYLLEGVKVLDFTRVLAGPFASRILADLGADVVKVEPPEGDMTRIMGRKINELSGYYTQQNVGKRSISVDLTKAGAAALMLRMAAEADVVMENFRPGIMASFGLGWDELSAVNPRLIMLSISGFGQSGPERDRASYAPIIHGEVGLLERQQFVDGGEHPRDFALSIADTYSGLHGVVGLLAALSYVQRTGIGQHVDMAMINAMFFTDDYAHFELENARIVSGGGQVFDAPGGPLMLAGDEKWYWRVLNTRAGLQDPTPEGADLETKITLRRQAIQEYLLSFTDREALLATLTKVNLAWGNVYDHKEVFERQGSIEGRAVLTEVDDRGGGRRRITNTPYRFSAAEAGVRRPAAYRGEHNYEAFVDWLGANEADIAEWHRAGILVHDDDAARLHPGSGSTPSSPG